MQLSLLEWMQSHYATLRVEVTATPKELRTAFRRAVLRHHPDRNPPQHVASANWWLREVKAAFDVLIDGEKRAAHEAEMKRQLEELKARMSKDRAAAGPPTSYGPPQWAQWTAAPPKTVGEAVARGLVDIGVTLLAAKFLGPGDPPKGSPPNLGGRGKRRR